MALMLRTLESRATRVLRPRHSSDQAPLVLPRTASPRDSVARTSAIPEAAPGSGRRVDPHPHIGEEPARTAWQANKASNRCAQICPSSRYQIGRRPRPLFRERDTASTSVICRDCSATSCSLQSVRRVRSRYAPAPTSPWERAWRRSGPPARWALGPSCGRRVPLHLHVVASGSRCEALPDPAHPFQHARLSR